MGGSSCAGGRLGTQRSLGGKPVPFNPTVFHLTNMWLAKRHGIYVDVYAGALVSAPRRGALVVDWTNPAIGTPMRKSGIYAPPKPVGAITLTCVRGARLFFEAPHGRGYFDLRSRRFELDPGPRLTSNLWLRGDLDGDGRADVAMIVHRVHDRHSQYLLVVRSTRFGLLRTLLRQRGIDPDLGWTPGELPTLASLARLGVAKTEIIAVNLVEGASTEGLGVYRLRGASLERLTIGGPLPSPPSLKDIFPYSGSNAGVFGIDCTSPSATVVAGAAAPYRVGWRLKETFYDLEGRRFVPVRVRSRIVHRLPHEFLRGPLGSCAGAVPRPLSHCADVDAPGTFPRSTLAADVDGDGRRDRVTVLRREPTGCPVVVVRGSRVGDRSAQIHQHGLDQPWPDGSTPPYLAAIARIGKGRRAEAVVVTWRGAATSSVAVFGLLGQRFVRYAVPHALPTDTFVVGGTVRTTYGVDCFRGRASGEVIGSSAEDLADGRYRIARTVYALRGRAFRPLRRFGLTRRTLPSDFGAQPFASCSTAVARRR